MEILDEQHAWTCGGMTHVRYSNDGGEVWREVAGFGMVRDGPCRLMSFVDLQNGWLASPNHMGVTSDGAASWTVMNSSGALYHTNNDGARWTRVSSLKPAGWEFARSVYAVVTMRFMDREHGIVVMYLQQDKKEKLLAFHTVDGARSGLQNGYPSKRGRSSLPGMAGC